MKEEVRPDHPKETEELGASSGRSKRPDHRAAERLHACQRKPGQGSDCKETGNRIVEIDQNHSHDHQQQRLYQTTLETDLLAENTINISASHTGNLHQDHHNDQLSLVHPKEHSADDGREVQGGNDAVVIDQESQHEFQEFFVLVDRFDGGA